MKGNWYYRVLQMGRGKRDTSPAIVTPSRTATPSQESGIPLDTTVELVRQRIATPHHCYDWVSSEEGETSETGRSAELAFVQ